MDIISMMKQAFANVPEARRGPNCSKCIPSLSLRLTVCSAVVML